MKFIYIYIFGRLSRYVTYGIIDTTSTISPFMEHLVPLRCGKFYCFLLNIFVVECFVYKYELSVTGIQ